MRFWSPERPVVVYPGNAGRVIETLCPKADIVVVMLGKNVYRALFIDPAGDIYPHERRLYLDVDDIRYQEMDEAIDSITTALLPRLTP